MRLVLALGAVISLIACGNPSAISNTTNQIAATDDQFGPSLDSVTANQNITWMFPSTNQNFHNVTWLSGPSLPPNSGERGPGAQNYVQFFGTPGTYTYYCTHHGNPDGTGMAGTLVVH
jgi:plastocyanin